MPNPSDHPALEAYNSATAYGQPHRLKNAVIELADALRDEYEARIKALEDELAAEREKRCGTCDRKVRGCTLRYLLPEWQDDDFGCTDWEATDA